MYAFLNLLVTSVDSLMFGFVITVVLMAITYGVLKMLSRDIVRSVPFYVTSVFLFFLLLYHTTVLVGATKMKGTLDGVSIYLSQITQHDNHTIDAAESQVLMDKIVAEYPALGSFVNIADFSGHSLQEVSQVYVDNFNSVLNGVIFKKILWIVVCLAIAVFIAMLSEKRKMRDTSATRHVRTERRRPSRSDQRTSRRRRY